MSSQLITILIAVLGALFNAAWSYFNLRWEKRIGEKIGEMTYSREVLDEREKAYGARLKRIEDVVF